MILKRLLLAGMLVFLNIASPASAFANENRVILDQLLTGDAPQLDASEIKIPDDLKPGFHELQVEVLDDIGIVSSKTALFCKDLDGELHFDNLCPDLLVTTQQEIFRSSLKPYSPNSDPLGTTSIALVAFAVASTLIGVGGRYSGSNLELQREEDESLGDLGGVSASGLKNQDKAIAWGDRRKYVNSKAITSLDELSTSLSNGLSTFSFLLARSVLDARYLRAIIGTLSWITIPAALVTSFIGLKQIDNQSLPFLLVPTLVLVCIGILDAFAGFVGAFLYLNFVFANGNFTSKDEIFTGLGVALLFFAPGLIASKFRPLTRNIKDFATFWERATDYLLATLLTGWSVSKLVQALPGLSKLELPIAAEANLIGIFAGIFVALRFLLEEIAWYLYPERIRKLTVAIKQPGAVQELRGIIFKVTVFFILAEPFIGFNNYLLIGCAIFLIPLLMGLVSENLPKSKYLAQINPRGSFKILLLSMISILVGKYLNNLELSNEDFILTSFVILPLPALLFIFIDAFSGLRVFDITKSVKSRWLYRALGIVVLGLLLVVILGNDPFQALPNFINNFSSYQEDFKNSVAEIGNSLVASIQSGWSWISTNIISWAQDLSDAALSKMKSISESVEFGWDNFATNMSNFWDWSWANTVEFVREIRDQVKI
jgi:hypothetical protein